MAKSDFDPKVAKSYVSKLTEIKKFAGKNILKKEIPFDGAPLKCLRSAGYISHVKNGKASVMGNILEVTPDWLAANVRSYWRDMGKKKANKGRIVQLEAPTKSEISPLLPYIEQTTGSVCNINKRLTNIESLLFRLVSEEKV